jgi:flagellar hook assembly protein FlgD
VTFTPTFTFTCTPTFTGTPSYTDTATITISPTVTQTPKPFPYILVLEAYNGAGEKIKVIAQAQIGSAIGDVLLLSNNQEASFFNPADGGLVISIPGVDSTDQEGGLTFKWDGTAENGGLVGQGDYFIKITVLDNYGHINTLVKEIKVLKTEEYARLSIYNAAGELVTRIQKNIAVSGAADLEMDDVVVTGEGAAPAVIKYTATDSFRWDGKSMQGLLVGSGSYEAVLEIKNADGYFKIWTSKDFTVLNVGSAPVLTGLKAYPNPRIIDDVVLQPVIFDWTIKQQGKIYVSIYNVAGELVKKLEDSLASPAGISWDCTASSGRMASSGLYVAVVRAIKADGAMETRILKSVIINRYSSDNSIVN